MSVVAGFHGYEMDASDAADVSRDRERTKTRGRRPDDRRKGSAPTRVNDIFWWQHCRWAGGGAGGSCVMNLRALAGCLAAAVLGMTGSAHATPIPSDFVKISGSNAAQTSGTNVGLGSVSYDYWMSSKETTVTQYAAFLSSQAKSDPFALYNSGMSTIGITRTGTSGDFSYSVAPPQANLPIAFVDWMAAVRYANWATSGSMNTGAYTIAGSGSTATRTGAGYVVPTASEWYKAAYYNPTLNGGTGGYVSWPTVSGSQPVAAVPPGSGVAANWNNVVQVNGSGVTIDVGSYTSTRSYYGMYDMLGNVAEWTETVTMGSARVFSGGYTTTSVGVWGADGIQLRTLTSENQSIGFRLASTVQPVPEPATITLAALGVVGLCGANWMRRRRSWPSPPCPSQRRG